MNESTQFMNDTQLAQTQSFNMDLARYSLVDIGWIEETDSEGYVTVRSGRFIAGKPVTFRHVEVLHLGTQVSGTFNSVTNSPCLILTPYSTVPNVGETKISTISAPYSSDGIKIIPLCGVTDPVVKNGFQSDGSYLLQSDLFRLLVSASNVSMNIGEHTSLSSNSSGVSILTNDNLLNIIFYSDKSSRILYFTEDGHISEMVYRAPDGVITKYFGSTTIPTASELADLGSYTNWSRIETINMDGTVDININEQASQKINLSIGPNITLAIDGSQSTTSFVCGDTSIEVDSSGGLSIKTGSDTTIESGGMLTLKNGSSSYFKVLNDIITTLNGGSVMTQGSPAVHNITPGQFAQALSDLQALAQE